MKLMTAEELMEAVALARSDNAARDAAVYDVIAAILDAKCPACSGIGHGERPYNDGIVNVPCEWCRATGLLVGSVLDQEIE